MAMWISDSFLNISLHWHLRYDIMFLDAIVFIDENITMILVENGK